MPFSAPETGRGNVVLANVLSSMQFLGDGFIALFGAPLAHEDHAHSLFEALRVPKYVERTEQLAKTFGVALSGEPPDDLSAA